VTGPLVTLGVPGYRGERFMAETLSSISAQTCPDFEVLISLDGHQPALEGVCQPFLEDRRFRLVVQPERLGWVGNLNWLMEHTTTPYWVYQQQDDVLEPTYLEVLLAEAARVSEAAVVYCDVVAFGTLDQTLVQPSVAGSPLGRQLALIEDHHSAVAFRGLTRTDAIRHGGPIRSNPVGDFSADTLWMSSIAQAGDLVRVPAPLYRKRFHDENEHTRWASWPEERRAEAWAVHCAHLVDEAFRVGATTAERRLLWTAVLHRLTTGRPSDYLPEHYRQEESRPELLRLFFGALRRDGRLDTAELMGTDWRSLRRWSRQWLRGPGSRADEQAAPAASAASTSIWSRLRPPPSSAGRS
jgi:glycosyltransferase involved in cell wall biosynthesis